jgi:hypothetical protein
VPGKLSLLDVKLLAAGACRRRAVKGSSHEGNVEGRGTSLLWPASKFLCNLAPIVAKRNLPPQSISNLHRSSRHGLDKGRTHRSSKAGRHRRAFSAKSDELRRPAHSASSDEPVMPDV